MVDTNVFLYVVFKDKTHYPKAEDHLSRAFSEDRLATPISVIFEVIRTLEYRRRLALKDEKLSEPRKNRLLEMLREAEEGFLRLLDSLNFEMVENTGDDVKEARRIEVKGLNFGDKILVAAMKRRRLRSLISADKKFDEVERLERLW